MNAPDSPRMQRRRAAVRALAGNRPSIPVRAEASAFAPVNIALSKYWGKRDGDLNLPVTGSVSISLGELGTRTRLRPAARDRFVLNDTEVDPERPEARRLADYLDLFRSEAAPAFEVVSANSIPTAAGLASSASGFAALARAMDTLFGWGLGDRELSILARLGSGSAARSITEGFVEWRAGTRADGADSFGEPWAERWPDLRIGLLILSTAEKPIGSGEAMRRTVNTSPLYAAWPAAAAADLETIRSAVRERNFDLLGRTAEANAMAMHATMIAARPAIRYWRPETIDVLDRIAQLRAAGTPLYATLDAGPNVKALFLADAEPALRAAFDHLRTVRPFLSVQESGRSTVLCQCGGSVCPPPGT